MNVRSVLSGLVLAAMACGSAQANPIVGAPAVLDPDLFEGTTVSQQICPSDLGPPIVNCLASPPNITGNVIYSVDFLSDGSFSASIDSVINPPTQGAFTELRFELWQGLNFLGGASAGAASLTANVFDALAYEIRVFYTFNNFQDNGSVRWSMTLGTSPDQRQVPEPGALVLMGLALTILAVGRRRLR